MIGQNQTVSRKIAEAHRLEGAVAARLKALKTRGKTASKVTLALELVSFYDQLSGAVYRTRNDPHLDPSAREALEKSFTNLSRELLAIRRAEKRPIESFITRYRSIFRRDFGLLLACGAIFSVCALLGLLFGSSRPEYAAVLMPIEFIERIIDHRPWFYESGENTFLVAADICVKNVVVSLKAFAYGALLGVGGLILICLNGIHFGAVLGYCLANGFDDQLGEFIASNGPLQIPIIVVSAFASLQYGRAFFTRPYRGFVHRLRQGVIDGCIIIAGSLPWLLFVFAIEGMVSASATLNPILKVTLGMISATLFWGWSLKSAR
jgi:uncharacterized membrane protein SpoIIM required for sporulation